MVWPRTGDATFAGVTCHTAGSANKDVWPVVERRMEELLEPAIELIHELFAAYGPIEEA